MDAEIWLVKGKDTFGGELGKGKQGILGWSWR